LELQQLFTVVLLIILEHQTADHAVAVVVLAVAVQQVMLAVFGDILDRLDIILFKMLAERKHIF
jgi:hypothetical protein